MLDLSTTYLGIPLKNPLVVAASSISNHVDRVKLAEESGAGALIIRSLFEEQIQLDHLRSHEFMTRHDEGTAEATSYFPSVKTGGASEHLTWVERTRKAVKMPIFASLNAVSPNSWATYARQLQDTGVNALELNPYAVETALDRTGADVEKALLDLVAAVRAEVKIPIAVKLGMFFTNTANVIHELEKTGVQGVVMFNRFLQPDIDPEHETLVNEMVYSTPAELKIPLRWIALMYGRTKLDLALSTGAHTARDAMKALLAGATVVQFAATLFKNGIPYLSTILVNLQQWMMEREYQKVDDFRGKLSQKNCDDPFAFERAQYVRLLLEQVK